MCMLYMPGQKRSQHKIVEHVIIRFSFLNRRTSQHFRQVIRMFSGKIARIWWNKWNWHKSRWMEQHLNSQHHFIICNFSVWLCSCSCLCLCSTFHRFPSNRQTEWTQHFFSLLNNFISCFERICFLSPFLFNFSISTLFFKDCKEVSQRISNKKFLEKKPSPNNSSELNSSKYKYRKMFSGWKNWSRTIPLKIYNVIMHTCVAMWLCVCVSMEVLKPHLKWLCFVSAWCQSHC